MHKYVLERPMVFLTEDSWNDYGFYTLYNMNYFDKNGNQYDLGKVKILHETENDTRKFIEKTFEKLPKQFCSLGQNLNYYEELVLLEGAMGIEILESLNDVVISKDIYEKFKELEGFNNSLIRFSQAEKALKEAGGFFESKDLEVENYKFRFKYKLKEASEPHVIPFDFSKDSILPNRINAIIGKNGTGKTQILAKIGAVASGYEKGKGQNFIPVRPSFSKIIAVSYSVFDEFDRPSGNGETFSYKYCGIRDKKNMIVSNAELRQSISNNLNKIRKRAKLELWHELMTEILGTYQDKILESLMNHESVNLSSGQSLILLTMTDLIAHIENESLVLFDEPENHLHPNALSNLIRVFNKILEEFDSYAIISTHSSIVVQEIPAKFIKVIERHGNVPFVRKLHIESFGENLTNITNEIFDVSSSESNYKVVLNKLSKTMSYESIIELFENELSYNAVIYLNKLFRDRDEK